MVYLRTCEKFSENSFNSSLQFIYQLNYVSTLGLGSTKTNKWLNKKRITEAKLESSSGRKVFWNF